MAAASDQLSRLLSLLPWLRAHPGVTKTEAAAAFGITTGQLERDLRLAFTCELPGRPEVFIDIDYLDSDRIQVLDPAGIDRPLRLQPDETVALLVGLRSLAAVPGLPDRAALDSALAKLEDAVQSDPRAASRGDRPADGQRAAQESAGSRSRLTGVEAGLPPRSREPAAAAAVQLALTGRRRVHLRYWVPSRDEVTERDVDPIRLISVDDVAYLEGFCHASEDVRTFRLDRIIEATVLTDQAVPQRPVERNGGGAVFHPSAGDTVVVLDLAPQARWVPEYYPCESVLALPDGHLQVTLRAADPGLAVRLVMRLGGDASVLSPSEVADRVQADIRATLSGYAESSL
jgi:predicted DNA-binding transcriptional regulator YafY